MCLCGVEAFGVYVQHLSDEHVFFSGCRVGEFCLT